MDKLNMETPNLTDKNIEKILELFPNVATEAEDENGKIKRAINFDKLKQELLEDVVDGDECYDFTWVGKREAIIESNKPIRKTLRPCEKESESWETTENLYIEGDNLDVLKLLQESYLNQVKMIYIDPPYNTGKDSFVYRDNFNMDKDEYEEGIEYRNEDGEINFRQNNDTNPRFHSDWCSMLYPRLKVARHLLKEDGVIFISIDDNEIDNLRKICDEVFGEKNTETLIWNKEANGSSGTLKQTSTTRRIHEYIICAYKNYNATQFSKVREALIGRENELQTANLAVNSENERTDHKNYFTITNPSGEIFTRQWKWSQEEINRLIEQDLIYWGSDGHKQPRLIIPTDDRRTTFLLSILNYGGTTVGRKDFEALMGESIEFSYPKPVILLKKILETATSKKSIILDFFSGSATTAHAVMQLNAEDGGNRKFIMVQLPETCDEKSEAYKAGYKTICEIGKERIRRAGKKIKEENPDKNIDTGFRVFKLDSTNMKDVYYTPAEYNQGQLNLLESNIKEDRNDMDLLYGVLLDWGVELSLSHRIEEIDGKRVHIVNNDDLIACFEENITETVVREIAKKQPTRAVFRDGSFNKDDHKINVEEIFKLTAPNTTVKVI